MDSQIFELYKQSNDIRNQIIQNIDNQVLHTRSLFGTLISAFFCSRNYKPKSIIHYWNYNFMLFILDYRIICETKSTRIHYCFERNSKINVYDKE